MTTATTLIDTSARTTSIAHGTYTAALHADLVALADDHVDTGATVDYWGTTELGGDFPRFAVWRVHLTRE